MASAHLSDPATPARLAGPRLRAAWEALRADGARLRARDAAERLGVSEGELVASQCGPGGTAVRLAPAFEDLLTGLTAAGPVMALTRNDHVVHEKTGIYDRLSFSGAMGMALNHDIDLRLFMNHWRHAFALREPMEDGRIRRSLQVFDASGSAVHKVFQTEASDGDAMEALIQRLTAEDQTPVLSVLKPAAPQVDRPDAEIDAEGLRAHWAAMQDTHEFFPLLKEFGVGRQQALRLAGPTFAEPAPATATRTMLTQAAALGVPIMCFVGNPGCIQIHSGPVETIKVMGPWLNVLDPGFNLHLREDRIGSSWLVRKPTRDGLVTSLELFDAAGQNFVMFFGERKPGKPEREDWRRLAESLTGAG